MVQKSKRPTLERFFDGAEVEMPQEQTPEEQTPETKPVRKRTRRKLTDDEVYIKAMSRWFGRVEKRAIAKARKYCSEFYQKEYRKARSQAMSMTTLSKRERLKRARLPKGVNGGFMGFARDEIVPDHNITNLEEYERYIATINLDDPQKMFIKWREEAMSEIPGPNIKVPEDDEPGECVIPDFILRRNPFLKRNKLGTEGIIVDVEDDDEDKELLRLMLAD